MSLISVPANFHEEKYSKLRDPPPKVLSLNGDNICVAADKRQVGMESSSLSSVCIFMH